MRAPLRAQCLGADALRTKDVRETHKLVIKHIAAVRRIPQLHDCTVVLVLECAAAKKAGTASGLTIRLG